MLLLIVLNSFIKVHSFDNPSILWFPLGMGLWFQNLISCRHVLKHTDTQKNLNCSVTYNLNSFENLRMQSQILSPSQHEPQQSPTFENAHSDLNNGLASGRNVELFAAASLEI